MKSTASITLMATTTFGLESIVAHELKHLGYADLDIHNGFIEFAADPSALAKTNLWLRCADRVYWKIAQFRALDFGQLFDQVKALDWPSILPQDAQFPITTITIKNSQLFSKSDSQAIIKKAIVERLKQTYRLERFPETGALYALRVHIINDKVSLYIDSSGEPLHKRGYRQEAGDAPIKETLAAAILQLARWGQFETTLWDPCCGTGTLPIEAALIAIQRAPGMQRSFVAEQWPCLDQSMWARQRQQAKAIEKPISAFCIIGSDHNEHILKVAKENARKAGVDHLITLQHTSVRDISPSTPKGIIVVNPPYGERLLEQKDAEKLYTDMGRVFAHRFPLWSYYVITSHEGFERLFGRKADKNRKLYNGGLKCYLYQYLAFKKSSKSSAP